MNKDLIKPKFFADKKKKVHFYYLLQIEYDLKQSFKECQRDDIAIIDDILVALAIWVKDSEMSQEKLSMQDIVALIVKMLDEHNYDDVVECFQEKLGFSFLSNQQLYKRLNKLIRSEKIVANAAIKAKVYHQLTKLGYKTNKISEGLIREVIFQESGTKLNFQSKPITNLPSWLKLSYYGYIFQSIRLVIDVDKLFALTRVENLFLDFYLEDFLGHCFSDMRDIFLLKKYDLDHYHYFSLEIIGKFDDFQKKEICYFLKKKFCCFLPSSLVIKLSI